MWLPVFCGIYISIKQLFFNTLLALDCFCFTFASSILLRVVPRPSRGMNGWNRRTQFVGLCPSFQIGALPLITASRIYYSFLGFAPLSRFGLLPLPLARSASSYVLLLTWNITWNVFKHLCFILYFQYPCLHVVRSWYFRLNDWHVLHVPPPLMIAPNISCRIMWNKVKKIIKGLLISFEEPLQKPYRQKIKKLLPWLCNTNIVLECLGWLRPKTLETDKNKVSS